MEIPLYNMNTELIEMIDTNHILYIAVDHTTIVLHTYKSRYRPISTLKDFLKFLETDGFQQVDKSVVANMNKITYYDERKRLAYFTKGKITKSCKVSVRNAKRLQDDM